jgi:membrane associated rhomboid family serine protease
MALADRSYRSGYYSSGGGMPPGVKGLLIANIAIFAVLFLARVFRVDAIPELAHNFALVPASVVNTFALWQLITYAFLHSDVMHILFNALYIWFIGSALENTWGTRRFLQFYFICALGGAVVGVLAAYLTGDSRTPIVGASGACFGLLVAFGVLFAEQTVIFFIFPMKAKYMVLILCGLQFLQAFTPSQTAFSVHIGGILTGLGYLLYYKRLPRLRLVDQWKQRYRQYKIERARKKFQVYLRKHNSGSDRDRFIN